MASQAAYLVEKVIGHQKENLKQDVSNYEGVGDPNETMKALVWQGKQKVEVGMYVALDIVVVFLSREWCFNQVFTDAIVDIAKPRILEDGDVILKVTGTTVCGSDLHLLHGMGVARTSITVSSINLLTGSVIQMKKGDILGHEFCGIVEQVGPAVKNIKIGKRYVAAFQITCGEVRFDTNCPFSLHVSPPLTILLDSAFTASRSFHLNVRRPTPTQPLRPCTVPSPLVSLGTPILRAALLEDRRSMCACR